MVNYSHYVCWHPCNTTAGLVTRWSIGSGDSYADFKRPCIIKICHRFNGALIPQKQSDLQERAFPQFRNSPYLVIVVGIISKNLDAVCLFPLFYSKYFQRFISKKIYLHTTLIRAGLLGPGLSHTADSNLHQTICSFQNLIRNGEQSNQRIVHCEGSNYLFNWDAEHTPGKNKKVWLKPWSHFEWRLSSIKDARHLYAFSADII